MVSQSVSLGVEPHLGLITRYLLLIESYDLVLWGALSDEKTGLSFVHAVGPQQHSLLRVRVRWNSWLYSLRFEDFLFVASYNSQGNGVGIRLRITSRSRSLLPVTSRHSHSWHQAPLGPMAIYLFSVKTFVFFSFRWSSLLIMEGLVFFYIDWCSLITPYSTWSYSLFFFSQGMSRIYILSHVLSARGNNKRGFFGFN
jgi:hypothetical protein